MDKQNTAGCRRSSRISALEEKARLLSLQEKTDKGQNSNSIQPLATRKRGRSRKTTYAASEEGDVSEEECEFFQEDSLSAGPSIPEQRILEFILDLLQRRDTHELFAQPVDPNEVKGYYDIVKEPMDFGTMRAKLQEGMYTSLVQFERDVFLISSNAMAFNAPTTMFYQEARALHESARKVFQDLQREPEKFHVECSRIRRRPGKKPLVDEARDARSKPDGVGNNPHVRRTAAATTPLPFLFSRFSPARHSGKPFANLPSGGPHGADKRMTYQPLASASKSDRDGNDNMEFSFNPDALKNLVRMPFPPGAYVDSLNRFTKDLGPVAQRIAQKKLAELRAIQSSERVQALGSTQSTWIPVLGGSRPVTLAVQPSQNFVMGHGQSQHPFLSRRSKPSLDGPNFISVAPVHPDRRSVVNLLPSQNNACRNQVPELSADSRSHGRTSSGIPNGMTFASTRPGNQGDHLFPVPPSVPMHTSFNWVGEEQAHQNINNFSASNKGKAVSSDHGRNDFSFLNNPIPNTKRGLNTEDRRYSPDGHSFDQGRTRHPDEENVEMFLAILGGNNVPAGQSPFDSLDDSFYPPASSSSQLSPAPTSSSPSHVATPSRAMCMPFQSECQLDQATRTYLQELRSGRFNAIAQSDAALLYQNKSYTNPVGSGQPFPMAPGPMDLFPGRQMQVNEHVPSVVRTVYPLEQPRVGPSQRVPPFNRASPSGGTISQDRPDQAIVGQSLQGMLQPSSSRNNGDRQQPGSLDLNV